MNYSCIGDPGIGFDYEFSLRTWWAGYQVRVAFPIRGGGGRFFSCREVLRWFSPPSSRYLFAPGRPDEPSVPVSLRQRRLDRDSGKQSSLPPTYEDREAQQRLPPGQSRRPPSHRPCLSLDIFKTLQLRALRTLRSQATYGPSSTRKFYFRQGLPGRPKARNTTVENLKGKVQYNCYALYRVYSHFIGRRSSLSDFSPVNQ